MNTKLIALRLLTTMQGQDSTYDELAEKTGIPKSSLQRYLTGEREIPLDRFKTICDNLGLDACEVLGWKTAEKNVDDDQKQLADIISEMTPETRNLAIAVLKRFAKQ